MGGCSDYIGLDGNVHRLTPNDPEPRFLLNLHQNCPYCTEKDKKIVELHHAASMHCNDLVTSKEEIRQLKTLIVSLEKSVHAINCNKPLDSEQREFILEICTKVRLRTKDD